MMGDHQDCARVCRVLAAQLREAQIRFETSGATLLSTLDRLEAQVGADGAGATLRAAIDSLVFAQAQEHDLIRQMMAMVAHALALLPKDIDVDGLVDLYITDAQRAVHTAALHAAMENAGAR